MEQTRNVDIHIHTELENTINILQVNRSWKVSDTKFLKLITSEHDKYKYLSMKYLNIERIKPQLRGSYFL